MRAALRFFEAAQAWTNALSVASNLCEAELSAGEIARVTATADKSAALGVRAGVPVPMWAVNQAAALHAAGQREKAARILADFERWLRERRAEFILPGYLGYRCCDLLLAQGLAVEVRARATQTVEIWRDGLDAGLVTLTLRRANLALALKGLSGSHSAGHTRADTRAGPATLDDVVEGLRTGGQSDNIVCGLLVRAAFQRTVGDWDGAARDLDEAQEIAEPGPMRLHLCDSALERARLALARLEAFAPLNGLVEPTPPPPVLPAAAKAAQLVAEAREELDTARKLITDCGYHRRDAELAELDAVAGGRNRFADLPPRV